MRSRTSRRASLRSRCACWIGPVCLACNTLTGVNDLEFTEPSAPEDAVTMNPLQPCDALTGAGCPVGETCRLSLEQGGPDCQPAPATAVAPYAACERDAQCPAAHRCVAGVCAELCTVEADCGWDDADCLDVGAMTLGFGHCSRNCELASPVAPSDGFQPCGAGTRCDFTAAGAGGYTDCVAAAPTSSEGGSCQANTDCPAGQACSAGRCQRYCDAGDNACPAGLTCGGIEALGAQQVGTCCQIPAGDACDSVTDCGCAAGETCRWDADTGAALCKPLADVVLDSGDTCSSDDQCPQHHSCFFGGVCSQQCYFSSDCAVEGAACTGVTFSRGDVPGRSVCARPCNPVTALAADAPACRPGTSCVQYADVGGRPDYFSCAIPGVTPEGGACQFNTDCAAGLGCFGATCSRWCASATDCGEGFACSTVTEQSGLDLGFCCAVPAGQACDPTSNCGCDAGSTCAVENGSAFCRPVQQGGVGPYEACDTDAQCPAQHVCVSGACATVCANSNDCGTPEARCYVPNGTTTSVCSRSCDPLSPQAPAPGYEACGAGLACADFFVDTDLFFTCMRPGLLPEGAVCSTADTPAPCQAGLSCFDACQRFCEIGTTCDSGDCLLVNPPYPVVNGREVGICP